MTIYNFGPSDKLVESFFTLESYINTEIDRLGEVLEILVGSSVQAPESLKRELEKEIFSKKIEKETLERISSLINAQLNSTLKSFNQTQQQEKKDEE